MPEDLRQRKDKMRDVLTLDSLVCDTAEDQHQAQLNRYARLLEDTESLGAQRLYRGKVIQDLKETMMYMNGLDTQLTQDLTEIYPEVMEEAQNDLEILREQASVKKPKNAEVKRRKHEARAKLSELAVKRASASRLLDQHGDTRHVYVTTETTKKHTGKTKFLGAILNPFTIGSCFSRKDGYDLAAHKAEYDEARQRFDELNPELTAITARLNAGVESRDERNALLSRSQELRNQQFPYQAKMFRIGDNGLPNSIVESRQIETSGGTLKGHLYRPDRTAKPDIPTLEAGKEKLVIFFSGSHGSNASQIATVATKYNGMGACVLGVDYRSFGKSTSKLGPLRTRCPTSLSEASLYKDGRDIYDYAINVLGYSPSNVILHGFSLGGAVASKIAADLDRKSVV